MPQNIDIASPVAKAEGDGEPGTEIEILGRRLYYELERLDPSYDGRKWEDLDGGEPDIYLLAIKAVIRLESRAVLLILANDGNVDGRPYISKEADHDIN